MEQSERMKEVTCRQSNKALTKSGQKVKEIAFVGLLGAASAVLMLFRFPIPFLPPFLSFDLSGLMEMMGGFMFGPAAAFCIIIVKILLQLVMQGSFSFGTGELQSLILSCTYVIPAVILYQRRKTKKNGSDRYGIQYHSGISSSSTYKFIFDHSFLCQSVRNDHGRFCCHVYCGKSGSKKRSQHGASGNFTI